MKRRASLLVKGSNARKTTPMVGVGGGGRVMCAWKKFRELARL